MKRKEHIHKYRLVQWGKKGTIVYRCMLPGCPHYVHATFIRNRLTICWQCGDTLVMTPDKMRRVKPKCDKCVKLHPNSLRRKDGRIIDIDDPSINIDALLEGLEMMRDDS